MVLVRDICQTVSSVEKQQTTMFVIVRSMLTNWSGCGFYGSQHYMRVVNPKNQQRKRWKVEYKPSWFLVKSKKWKR